MPEPAAEARIVVVGAGLVGSLLAVILQERGYRVALYERYADLRSIPSLGRSINLVATVRGLRALSVLPPRVKEELLQLGTHVTGRIIHAGGEQIFQRYGKDDTEFNHSISRYELNKFLLSQAEAAGVELHFGHVLKEVGWSGEFPSLRFRVAAADGGGAAEAEVSVACAGPVLAADGGGSAVREAMRGAGLCAFSSELLDSGYKEMLFPAEAAASLPRHGLHIWPRGQHMLMALANKDGSFTGTVYMSNEAGAESFKALEEGGAPACASFLEQHYPTAVPLLGGVERAAEQLAQNARGILGTVRAAQWAVGGKAVLLGDAAHAIVPFFGQGMNSGFEDVRELAQLLETHAPPGASAEGYAAAFAAFEAARKPNADAIADMALENYEEMQAATADPEFRKTKAVENALENSALGDRFRSRYAMVCYGGAGNVSYSAAKALGEVQWAIMRELAAGVSSSEAAAEELDLGLAAQLLSDKLAPLQRQLGIDLNAVSHHE